MKRRQSFNIKLQGVITKIWDVESRPDGSKILILFPEKNKRGFHATEHPSGISNIRTADRKIDLYNVKKNQLIDIKLLQNKLRELIGPVKGKPIAASIIFNKKINTELQSNTLDLDEIAKNTPYGTWGLIFKHLRHNRLKRLQKYLNRKDQVFILTSEGLEYGIYSINPLIGILLDGEAHEAIFSQQPIAKIINKAFADS